MNTNFPNLLQKAERPPVRGNGQYGAAHIEARDAYKDVPMLRQPTWQNEIAAYFYLGGITAGAQVLGALASMSGEKYRSLARTAHLVAFATMVPCVPLLIMDLGRPSRFHHMLRIFKPESPMNLGSWTLTIHGGITALFAARVLARSGKLPLVGPLFAIVPERPLALVGVAPALTLGGYTGVLIGTTSVPVWSTSSLLGGLFTASAFTTGTAAVQLASILSGRDEPQEHRALGPLNLLLDASDLALTAGYLATSGRAAKPMFSGLGKVFTFGGAAASAGAFALELVGMRSKGNRRMFSGLAAGSALLGGALLRWGIVRSGHTSANDREGTLEATKPSAEAPGWQPPRWDGGSS